MHLAKIRDTQEEISMSVQEQARKFMLANDASPVVAGEVIGNGGQGGRYTLKDGRTFTLPLEVARAVPARKSVVSGKSWSGRVEFGGGGIIKQKKHKITKQGKQ